MAAPLAAAVDQHCHSVWRNHGSVDALQFRRAFTESADLAISAQHLSTSLGYRRELAALAELYECSSDEDAILRARARFGLSDLLRQANVVALLVDGGVAAEETLSLAELQEQAGVACHPILRIETVAQDVLARAGNFEGFGAEVRERLLGTLAVAFKSIIAYRAGLDVGQPDRQAAETEFEQRPARLAGHALEDWLLDLAMQCAQQRGLPVQFHCGWGDADEDLRLANPLFLRPLILEYPRLPVVLLHCYPYHRQAGYLAAVHANVYVDLSLTLPHLAEPVRILSETLEVCPASKLLYASDALGLPEVFWLGAHTWRQALPQVVPDDLARLILNGNAQRLYRLASEC